MNYNANDLGQRILIWGSSCAGKSTLAEQLSAHFNAPCIDLDALNWLPNWVGLNDTDPARLERRFDKATQTQAWVAAGSYTTQAQASFWPRLDTIIWLDLPLRVLLYRLITRSWRRWRNQELLWGTNYENFWQQLQVWKREDSLLWWIVTHYKAKRAQSLEFQADPRWSHIRWVHLRSSAEVKAFKQSLGIVL